MEELVSKSIGAVEEAVDLDTVKVFVLVNVIVGEVACANVNVPAVVIVPVPVFVNNPVRDGSTVSDTEVTEPDPADGLTQVSEDLVLCNVPYPVEDKY